MKPRLVSGWPPFAIGGAHADRSACQVLFRPIDHQIANLPAAGKKLGLPLFTASSRSYDEEAEHVIHQARCGLKHVEWTAETIKVLISFRAAFCETLLS